ncbi:MAG: alpha-L-rhamnosidase [Bacteroidetes bacterium]|nr:MAG: alpha-L-rhamnosidase [Bacteroidota bacterium]
MRYIRSFPVLGLLLVIAALLSCKKEDDLRAERLTCNFREQPMAIDSTAPLLAWQIRSKGSGVMQSAYRVIVAGRLDELNEDQGTIWDSGKTDSDRSINVPYEGNRLKAGKRYYWKVKIWDEKGQESPWSEVAWWQTGLFSESDWQGARWISYETMDSSMVLVPGVHGKGDHLKDKALQRPVVPQFRKSFSLEKDLISATLSISGLGHYEAYINGQTVGESFLAPGWTDYDKTVFYNTYDVTPLLKKGENVLGAIVGNGFYNINRERYRKLVIAYGFPTLIAHLRLAYSDGSSEVLVSDKSWRTTPSPISYASIFGGEDYDASLAHKAWKEAGYNDSVWVPVKISDGPSGKLRVENDYPLKEMKRSEVQSIISLGDTAWLYDFGQNASGIIELRVKGKPGQEIRLWPAELINPDSTVNQGASGHPFYFSYTLNGQDTEIWKPRFSYYGFRYVQVNGGIPIGENNPEGLPEIEGITFLHTRNSSPVNGTFSSSNDLLNRIHRLIDWAIRSNFQSVLTDCPHREKLGWLEQTHLMGQGLHFRYHNYHLYRKLVYDMMDAQTSDGLVPDIAPEYVEFTGGFRDSPEWGSAAVILPYLLWKWYGDRQILEEAWPMMIRYIHYLKHKSRHHILNHGLGDWFDLGPEQPGVSQLTPVSLTATAIYFYDVKLMSEMAALLDKPEKVQLQQWAAELRKAFNEAFFNPETMVYSTGSQTAMSMPYCMGIVDDQYRSELFEHLVDSIIAGNMALTAGDVGFHYLVEALTEGRAAQLMFDMINRDDVPGYGFQLKKGATALTESWAALETVSNNHLMLGHVMEWFYAGLGGIGQAKHSSAYKEIIIQPQLAGDLEEVKTSFQSPYGLLRSEWKKKGSGFEIEVEIPHNTRATLVLPTKDRNTVKVNGDAPDKELADGKNKDENVRLHLGSGVYLIQSGIDLPALVK